MKRDEEKVAKLLKAELPSEAEMESAALEVLQRLRSTGASAEVPNEYGLNLPADEIATEVLLDGVDGRRPVRPWWQIPPIWAAAAFAALVLLSIPLARRFVATRTVYAIVDNEDGQRYSVAAGQIIATDVWTRLTVALADGSRVEMHPQSQLSVNDAADGLRIQLDRGGIIVNAARQRTGHLYVHTKDVDVSVVGTVFLVGVEDAGSRVGVLEGKVRVKQGGSTRMMLPPEQMATNPLMELPPLSEQVVWSRHAKEHLALLPQEATPVVAKQAEKPGESVKTQAPPQLNAPKPAAARPQFEVASVKRNNSGGRGMRYDSRNGRYSATNTTLGAMITQAYRVQSFQIIGAPAWIDSERYDVEGKAEDAQRNAPIGPMLQSLIEERFNAAIHGETRDLPVYFLTVAKDGPKVKGTACLIKEPNTPLPPNQPQSAFCGYFGSGIGSLIGTGQPIENLADMLSGILRRKVLDRTGLAGKFDLNLKWTPDSSTPAVNTQEAATAPAPEGPSIFTAIEEQLGLKLESGKAPIDVLVIDHIEHASEN